MKKIFIIAFTLIFVFNSDITAQNSHSSDLLAFDNAVRSSRVEMHTSQMNFLSITLIKKRFNQLENKLADLLTVINKAYSLAL